MSKNLENARQFYEACDTGKGWGGCKQYCYPDATFSAQAGAMDGITTVEGYTNWMRDLFTPIPDGHYELLFFAEDEIRESVVACGMWHVAYFMGHRLVLEVRYHQQEKQLQWTMLI